MKIFLSSTFVDLVPYRKAVTEALERLGSQVDRMEIFGARPEEATGASQRDLEESELFVGIYAHRYGYNPANSDMSITEQEYHHAMRLKKPMFCFIVNEDHPWAPSMVEDDPGKSKLRAFKAQIRTSRVTDAFNTPEDLASRVVSSVGYYITHSETGKLNKLEDIVVNLAVEKFDISIAAQRLRFYLKLRECLQMTNKIGLNQWMVRKQLEDLLKKHKDLNDKIHLPSGIRGGDELLYKLHPFMNDEEIKLFDFIRRTTEDIK